MQLTVTFSDKTISIMNKEGIVNLSPYFYYFNQRVMIGKQIEQAIDLFPEYISNVFLKKMRRNWDISFKSLMIM